MLAIAYAMLANYLPMTELWRMHTWSFARSE